MKKILAAMISFLVAITSVSGCSVNGSRLQEVPQKTAPIESAEPAGSRPPEISDAAPEPVSWQEEYILFLQDFPADEEKNIQDFSLRDINNDGITELLVIQTDGILEALLTVYTYDGGICKTGEYSNPKLAAAGLRTSSNQLFPGVFTVWWGGGTEHYGYLTIQGGELEHEDLWYIDRTKEPPYQKEVSDNKQLIRESMNAHPPYEYTENIMVMHSIKDGDIAGIIRGSQYSSNGKNVKRH